MTTAAEFSRSSLAPATVAAYALDWRIFERWCRKAKRKPLPCSAATLVEFLTHLAKDHRPAGIERKLVSISQRHKAAGKVCPRNDPKVAAVLAGIRRELGTQQTQKAPMLVGQLRKAVAKLSGPDAVRDRAVLLFGFAGAFRRSELAALCVEDLEWKPAGVLVTIRRSKTDHESKGQTIGIPKGGKTCPVVALKMHLKHAGVTDGRIFDDLDGPKVSKIVKRAGRSIGMDPKTLGGHSLRAGFVTSAILAGKSELSISRVTRHTDMSILHRYVRIANALQDNAGEGLL